MVALALVSICILTGLSCRESGHLFGSADPVPGRLGEAHAAGNAERPISLVSLLFLESEGIQCLSVADRISDKSIPFRSSEWEGKAVVTLELAKDRLANPRLAFSGGASFTALLTPEQSLSTFDGLSFGDHTVFLRDHGVEIELKAGVEKVISQYELTDLWDGEKLVRGARVRFSPGVSGNYTPVLAPSGTVEVVEAKSGLRTLEGSLQLNDRESASLVVVPPQDTDAIHLTVVAR